MQQRMGRAERRAQILDAATRAFAASGYSATGLDDVAAEAGISRVILYRHFESKAALYRAVLDRACDRLDAAVGSTDLDETSIEKLLQAASADPDGFRILFRHAAREPEFADYVDRLRAGSTRIAQAHLTEPMEAGPWQDWAAALVPIVALEAVLAWLDAGQPDGGVKRVGMAIHGVISAAICR